jgi:hypothetical protein
LNEAPFWSGLILALHCPCLLCPFTVSRVSTLFALLPIAWCKFEQLGGERAPAGSEASEDTKHTRQFKNSGQAAATVADSSRDAKPAISFACLIGMAVLESPNQRLTVSEVYEWMKRSFPYFNSAQVRHLFFNCLFS